MTATANPAAAGPVIGGLDGGGTKTECVIYDPATGRLGWARAGPLNTNYISADEAARNALSALTDAAATAGSHVSCLRLLVVAAPWSEALVAEVARRSAPEIAVEAAGEDRAALMGGWLRPSGLVLTAGTGSRCAWIPDTGTEPPIVTGAWGSLFGDEGSGYDIGCRALRAAARHWDGRGPATALGALVESAWQLEQPKAVVRFVYGPPPGGWRGRIAALCPLVGRAAADGDQSALDILDQAAAGLAEMVAATARLAGLRQPYRLLTAGGVFGLGELLLAPLRGHLATLGAAEIFRPELTAAYGALLLAATKSAGPPPEAGLVAACRRHYSERQRGRGPGIMYNGPSEEA